MTGQSYFELRLQSKCFSVKSSANQAHVHVGYVGRQNAHSFVCRSCISTWSFVCLFVDCSWELQGSTDGFQWTALHRQMDSAALLSKPHLASWPIARPGTVARADIDETNHVVRSSQDQQQPATPPRLLSVRPSYSQSECCLVKCI